MTTLGLEPSFGFGDRLGLATPGHVAALRASGGSIKPIFAQQSIREMTRTGRTPEQVIGDAIAGAAVAGYDEPMGADADHLKTPADVDRTASAGFRFFTIDPSDHVDGQADSYDQTALEAKFRAVRGQTPWIEYYRGKNLKLPTGTRITFDDQTLIRAAVKYGRALAHAITLSRHIGSAMAIMGQSYEIELSIDETPQPTTPAEHFIIADRMRQSGLSLISLAPRLLGDFEKGVDYKGNLAAFERSLADHVAIARELGPYKLSLHSGSDKLAIYGIFARVTAGLWHVKTAGTSYLESLRVVCRHDVDLFRRIVDFSRNHYDNDRATYHVSATLSTVPPPSEVPDSRELEKTYLGLWSDVPPGQGLCDPGRQILHTTYGSVLADRELKPAIMQVLSEHHEDYREILQDHFSKHLKALCA